MPSVSLQILILGDVYLLEKTGCINKLYNPQETANYYVEITLSGCKYLCEFLHDLTCTLLVWIPSQRSCILQPLLETSLLHEANPCNGCLYAEILHRQRKTGHCYDVIMSSIASQITSLTIVYSTVYSGTDERKHQCPASLAFVRGIHRWPVNSAHKGPVMRKMFQFDDVIMWTCGWGRCPVSKWGSKSVGNCFHK